MALSNEQKTRMWAMLNETRGQIGLTAYKDCSDPKKLDFIRSREIYSDFFFFKIISFLVVVELL